MRLCVLLWVCPILATAQQSSPNDDAKTLLVAVRAKVMQTVSRLPKYLCTETIDRVTFVPERRMAVASCDDLAVRRKKADWKFRKETSDRLRLDVAISSYTEMYSWAGEDHFQDRTLSDLVRGGTTSTGAFASILSSIFGTQAASFTYNGDVTSDGRVLAGFGFRVPIEQSEYRIGNLTSSSIVPFDGTFLVDPKTSELVSLMVQADHLPAELNVCEDVTTLEYSSVRLNGAEFLLPKSTVLRIMKSNGNELENSTSFSDCHEFRGKSTLSFDTDAVAEQAMVKRAHQPVTLPAGLSFRVTLRQPLDTATAAAGDLIKMELKSAIKESHHGVLVPKGALVTARIVEVKRVYGEADRLTVGVRLETIEVNGAPQPIDARLGSLVKRRMNRGDSLVPRQDVGRLPEVAELTARGIGMLEFESVLPSYVIDRGFEIEGATAAPPSSAEACTTCSH